LDIASRILNRYFYYFKKYYSFLVVPSFFLLIILLYGFQLQLFQSVFIILSLTLFYALIIALLVVHRNQELNLIREILEDITHNRVQSSTSIHLTKELPDLEQTLKAMFSKIKNDINYLKKLEQTRTEFLGNVSHELRTPIFAIQGYLETLLNGAVNDPNVNKKFLKKALFHTDNLNMLLEDLIDISMIESGQMRLKFQTSPILPVLNRSIEQFSEEAEKKGLKLSLKIDNPDLELFFDPERIIQVLTNLLSNSIKYSDKGEVKIIVDEKKHGAKITVRDTGFGISPKDIDRIFERFYRTDRDRSRQIGGTGLGLAIVKHIVEAHNSKIEVDSKIGVGSEFSFFLKKYL